MPGYSLNWEASAFIRDLHYNADLRIKFFEALNQPNDALIESAVDELIKANRYHFDNSHLWLLGWSSKFSQLASGSVSDEL